jgi:hypothetical protein
MGNGLNGVHTNKRTETVAMSHFFSHPSILVQIAGWRGRREICARADQYRLNHIFISLNQAFTKFVQHFQG